MVILLDGLAEGPELTVTIGSGPVGDPHRWATIDRWAGGETPGVDVGERVEGQRASSRLLGGESDGILRDLACVDQVGDHLESLGLSEVVPARAHIAAHTKLRLPLVWLVPVALVIRLELARQAVVG